MLGILSRVLVPARHWGLIATLFFAAACSGDDGAANPPGPTAPRPGTSAIDRDSVVCASTSDCAQGEVCAEGVCQVQRCASQTYRSAAPMGKRSYFSVDREIVVLNDASARRIDAYEALDGSFAATPSARQELGNTRIVDLTAGNLTGKRPESVAYALDATTTVTVLTGASKESIEVGFAPVALAAGDVDDDGVDELAVLGKAGEIALCRLADKSCSKQKISDAEGRDVTIADLDGSGQKRPVFVVDRKDGKSRFVEWNTRLSPGAEGGLREWVSPRKLRRLSAGRFGEGTADKLIALEAISTYFDPNVGPIDLPGSLLMFGLKDQAVSELSATPATLTMQDVTVGDINADGTAEVLVLEPRELNVFDAKSGDKGALSLVRGYKSSLTSSTNASRLVLADLDGDSPGARLEGEAELTPGPLVPMTVLVYPPYSRSASDGTSQIAIGTKETDKAETFRSVGLKLGAGISFEADIPLIARVELSVQADKAWKSSESSSRSVSVGDNFSVDARPDLEGPGNGAVVLGCGCYHAYRYRVEDPKGKLGGVGGDGKLMELFVPVGGQTTLWSVKRYNDLAARVGDIPPISVPYVVGDPATYPKKVESLSGKPIAAEDMVFSAPRPYRVSDVARVGWSLGVSDSVSQTESSAITVGARLRLRGGFVGVEGSVSKTWEEGYSLTVSRETTFSGTVPPIRNDARTPEDEFALYGYSFSPFLYRHRYKGPNGETGGFFVVTHSVGDAPLSR